MSRKYKNPPIIEAKTYTFKVVVEPDADRWHAYCPALEHYAAATWGYTREDAYKNIQELVEMIVEGMTEDGVPIPEPAREKAEVPSEQLVTVAPQAVEERNIRSLEQLYTFRKPQQVSSFLQAHSFLVPLLFEAYIQIEQHFRSNPQVFLQVVTDPEAADDRELFIFIGTNLPPDEALDRLDRLDEEWWFDAMDSSKGGLCIDVEFL